MIFLGICIVGIVVGRAINSSYHATEVQQLVGSTVPTPTVEPSPTPTVPLDGKLQFSDPTLGVTFSYPASLGKASVDKQSMEKVVIFFEKRGYALWLHSPKETETLLTCARPLVLSSKSGVPQRVCNTVARSDAKKAVIVSSYNEAECSPSFTTNYVLQTSSSIYPVIEVVYYHANSMGIKMLDCSNKTSEKNALAYQLIGYEMKAFIDPKEEQNATEEDQSAKQTILEIVNSLSVE